MRRLVRRGRTVRELESELASRGLVYPSHASHDPAENPAAMARLETLVEENGVRSRPPPSHRDIPTEAAVLERDDYRCGAPGRTARKHLEVHHIVFRSQGGSEAPTT